MAEEGQATSLALNSDSYAKPARKIKAAAVFWAFVILIAGGLILRGCVFKREPGEPGNLIEAALNVIPTGADAEQEQIPKDDPVPQAGNSDFELFNYSNEAPPFAADNVAQDFIITDIAESPPPPPVESVAIDATVAANDLSQEERLRRFNEGFTETQKEGLVKRSGPPAINLQPEEVLLSGLREEGSSGSSRDPLAQAKADFLTRYYGTNRPGKITGGGSLGAGKDANKSIGPGTAADGTSFPQPTSQGGYADIADITRDLNNTVPTPEIPPETAPPLPPSGTQQAYDFVNNLAGQQSFRNYERAANPYANSKVIKASSPFVLREGKIIKVIIDRAINTDEPGATSGLIQENIYDSVYDRFLLIPRGSRVMLSYNATVRPKQKRLQLRAERILFPNANSMNLSAPIHDEHGSAGLAEPLIDIDNHYDEVFKTFATNSIVDRALDSASSLFSSDSAQSAKEAILFETVQKDLARKPTITLSPGKIVYIILTKDIIMEPYLAT